MPDAKTLKKYLKKDDAALVLVLRSMLPEIIELMEAADQLIEGSVTRADILEDGSVEVHHTKVNPSDWSKLYDSLKALKEKKIG